MRTKRKDFPYSLSFKGEGSEKHIIPFTNEDIYFIREETVCPNCNETVWPIKVPFLSENRMRHFCPECHWWLGEKKKKS